MSTTSIVAEILIAGLQALGWVTGVVLTVFGTGWVPVEAGSGWVPLLTVLAIAIAYTLGVIVNRVADTFLGWLRGEPGFGRERLRVLELDSAVSRFIEFQRSQLRVARATAVNTACGLVAWTLFILVRTDVAGSARGAGALVAGELLALVLLVSAYASHHWISESHERRVRDVLDMVDAENQGPAVALVAVRTQDGGPLFCLVRTAPRRGAIGRRWVFPKGRIKGKDKGDLRRTAAREAAEEAGLQVRHGDLELLDVYDHGRLVVYTGRESGVETEHEPLREPVWLSAAEAREHLRVEREGRRHRKDAQMWCKVLSDAEGRFRQGRGVPAAPTADPGRRDPAIGRAGPPTRAGGSARPGSGS